MMRIKRSILMVFLVLMFTVPVLANAVPEQHKEFSPSVGESWLTGFGYRQQINILQTTDTNNYSGAYSLKFDLEYGYGNSNNRWIYLQTHSQTDFDDVRFTDSDGITEFSYWCRNYTLGINATFWVEVNGSKPVLSDSPSGYVTIFIYYGNNIVSSTSNGEEVFPYFDDFEDGNLALGAYWTVSNMEIKSDRFLNGDYSVGTDTIGSDAYIELDTSWYSYSYALHFSVNAQNSLRGISVAAYTEQDKSEYVICSKSSYEAEPSKTYYYDGTYTAWSSSADDIYSDLWYDFQIRVDGDLIDPDMRGYHEAGNYFQITTGYDGEEDFHTITDVDPSSPNSLEWLRITTQANYECWVDDVFIRPIPNNMGMVQISSYEDEENNYDWHNINEGIVLIVVEPYTRYVDVILVIGGLCMLPISTVYLAYNRKNMDQDKVFYFLILFLMGWGLFIGGIWP